MSAQTNQVKSLNKLITTLYDGENGYKESAKNVENTALKTRFLNLAQQRYDFGHAIKPFIKQLGGTVDKGGSLSGDLHRVWMDIKSTVSTQDEEAILEEIVRGEEVALKAYNEVLEQTDLPAAARETITEQRNKIQAVTADMRRLETVAE